MVWNDDDNDHFAWHSIYMRMSFPFDSPLAHLIVPALFGKRQSMPLPQLCTISDARCISLFIARPRRYSQKQFDRIISNISNVVEASLSHRWMACSSRAVVWIFVSYFQLYKVSFWLCCRRAKFITRYLFGFCEHCAMRNWMSLFLHLTTSHHTTGNKWEKWNITRLSIVRRFCGNIEKLFCNLKQYNFY